MDIYTVVELDGEQRKELKGLVMLSVRYRLRFGIGQREVEGIVRNEVWRSDENEVRCTASASLTYLTYKIYTYAQVGN